VSATRVSAVFPKTGQPLSIMECINLSKLNLHRHLAIHVRARSVSRAGPDPGGRQSRSSPENSAWPGRTSHAKARFPVPCAVGRCY
jgi:hypothetical protein